MTERERLIELLKVKNHCDFADCEKTCYGRKNGSYCMPADVAKHLLENGVIVPPCKAGDMVWYIRGFNRLIKDAIVDEIVVDGEGVSSLVVTDKSIDDTFEMPLRNFYFTPEEAEKALEEKE